MPCRPAAITAAKARYGLASPPGMRVSARRAAPCPTTRKPQVRLSLPQASVVGAHEPAANRLYELIVGARNTASSLKQAICPASQRENSVSSSRKHGSPSRHSDEWMWHELPIQSSNGFDMNVIEQPLRNAISLAPFL